MVRRIAVVAALLGLALVTSSYVVSPSTVLVDPSTDIQAAINSFSTSGRGGIVQLGPGVYTLSSGLTLPAFPPVSLIGSGIYQTQLNFGTMNADSSCITVLSGAVTIQDLDIVGPAGTTGTGNGIVFRSGPYGSDNNTIRNVQIYNVPGSVLYLSGTSDASYLGSVYPSQFSNVENCFLWSTAGATNTSLPLIHVGTGALLWRFTNDWIANSAKQGVVVSSGGTDGIYFSRCVFGSNDTGTKEFVVLKGTRNAVLSDCWFEGNAAVEDTTYYKLLLEPDPTVGPGKRGGNYGTAITNCFFVTGWPHLKAIKITGTSGSMTDYGIRITNCWGITDSTAYAEGNSIYVGDGAGKVVIAGGGVRNQASIPVNYAWGVRHNATSAALQTN